MIDRQVIVAGSAVCDEDIHKIAIDTDISIADPTAITTIPSTIMPSKQANDVLGVEQLVHEIKENLRLKARPSHSTRSSRPSPYHIPCRSWSDSAACDKQQILNQKQPKKEETIDDPYELLQTLLKSNNLVKEAVRRLQLNYSPKQRIFYDSDEEASRSPIIRMCQLEL